MVPIIISIVLFLSAVCVYKMFKGLSSQPAERLSPIQYLKLSVSGVLAFISDTIGVGSFAANIALAKLMGTFKDEELPPLTNAAQIIPGALSAICFMKVFHVDPVTLITLVTGASLGGILGGHVVSRLNKQTIRITMLCCFLLVMGILVAHQLHLFPIGGDLLALHGWMLVVGFFGMVICGALPAAGIGLFAMVQAVLFLIGMSPTVAFPIMTTAGAVQQPLTTYMFLQRGVVPLKRTLILSLAGCIGVLIALPLVSSLSAQMLRMLLLCIMTYNFIVIGKTYLRSRGQIQEQRTTVVAEA